MGHLRKLSRSQKGITLLLAILVLSSILAISFSLATILFVEIRVSGDLARTEGAIYGSTGIAEQALFDVGRQACPSNGCAYINYVSNFNNGVRLDSQPVPSYTSSPIIQVKVPANTTFTSNPLIYNFCAGSATTTGCGYGAVQINYLHGSGPVQALLCQFDPNEPVTTGTTSTYSSLPCSDETDNGRDGSDSYWVGFGTPPLTGGQSQSAHPIQTWDATSGFDTQNIKQQELILYNSGSSDAYVSIETFGIGNSSAVTPSDIQLEAPSGLYYTPEGLPYSNQTSVTVDVTNTNVGRKVQVIVPNSTAAVCSRTQYSVQTLGVSDSSVVVQGKYAYIADNGANMLYVEDVSNPSSPQVVAGPIPSGGAGDPRAEGIIGNYLYITNQGNNSNGSLSVFDISSSTNPIFKGAVAPSGAKPRHMIVSGNYIYQTDNWDGGLTILDTSLTPWAPTIKSATTTLPGSQTWGLTISGHYVYIGGNGGAGAPDGTQHNVMRVDIQDPNNPVIKSSSYLVLGGTPVDVGINNGYAYVVNYDNSTLTVVDPNTMTMVGSPIPLHSPTPYNIRISGGFAYMGGNNALDIYDITSNPSNPSNGYVTTFVKGAADGLQVVGNLIYSTSGVVSGHGQFIIMGSNNCPAGTGSGSGPGPATHFSVSAPASSQAGQPITNVVVTALDVNNIQATSYSGTVHFTSSDGSWAPPGDATLINGTGTFTATLNTTGSQTITATDRSNSTISGTSNLISVFGAANKIAFSTVGSPTTAGSSTSFTITVQDSSGNIVRNYTGKAHFTSTDPSAALPADYTFTSGDAGVHTFTAAVFNTIGSQTLTATDFNNSSINGNTPVQVTAGSFTGNVKITVNNGQVPSAQPNFPMLINIPASDPMAATLKSAVVSSQGYDILFAANPDGSNPYNSEIESYNSGTGALVAWVNVPSVTNGTVFYMLYGKAGLSSYPNSPSAVWDSNYKGVWHLGNGANLSGNDSSSSGNNSTAITATVSASGKMDGAANFNGSQRVSLPNIALTSGMTLEAWIYPTGINGWDRILCKAYSSNASPWTNYCLNLNGSSPPNVMGAATIGGTNNAAFSNSTISANTWTDVAATYNGSNVQVYVNGQPDGSPVSASGNIDTVSQITEIGYNTTFSPQSFSGIIDEAKISSISRSAAWLKTEYNNQSNPGGSSCGGFYIFGNTNCGSVGTASFNVQANLTATVGNPTNFTVVAMTAGGATSTNYTGTVTFNSASNPTGGTSTLPSNYTFTLADGGIHSFPATFGSTDTYNISVTDTGSSSITGTSGSIAVSNPSGPCNTGAVGTNQMVGCVYQGVNFDTLNSVAPVGNTASGNADNFTALPYTDVSGGVNGIPNTFSIRWKGNFNFSGGTYLFTPGSDDGTRVFVDGNLVVDNWNYQGYTQKNGAVSLSAGTHQVILEYFQGGGGAAYSLSWKPTAGCNTATVGTNQMVGCVYDGVNFDVLDSVAAPGPTASGNADNFTALPYTDVSGGVNGIPNTFSIRWKGNFNFSGGTYLFTPGSDDGSKVYVDGTLVVNNWNYQPYTQLSSGSIPLSAGTHQIVMEYFQGGGGAAYSLAWSRNSGPTTGTLVINKTASGGDGSFSFTVSGASSSTPSLTTSGGSGTTGSITVGPGTYSVTETVPGGWAFNSATCSNGSASGNGVNNISISAGSTVTCTFSDTNSGSGWYATGGTWAHRRLITVSSANVSQINHTSLSAFPVLVTASVAAGKADGTDILFTASDGLTKLPHELEKYAGGQVTAWVKLDLSASANTTFYIYYGNASAPDMQTVAPTKTAVWDSNYFSVHHFPNGTTLSLNDSTSNSDTYANQLACGGGASAITGEVDGAANFPYCSPVGEYYIKGTNTMAYQNFTSEFWLNMTTSNGSHQDAISYDGGPYFSLYMDSGNKLEFYVYGGGDAISNRVLSTNTWYHIAAVADGSHTIIYINGAPDTTVSGGNILLPPNGPNYLMSYSNTGVYQVDEYKVSKIGRSADWINTEYLNQSNPGSFASVGAEQ